MAVRNKIPRPPLARALRYAEQVVDGRIPVCRYVQQACERQLRDLSRRRWPYRFDPLAAERVCRFAELLPHIKGPMVATPGDVIDFDRIEADILEAATRFQVREIAYDPWQATQLATRLQAQGASVIEFRQTVANFSEPTKQLDALMRSGKIGHDNDPVLAWMIGNVVGHYDAKENVYPRKERPENKIDGAVALIMAIGRHMVFEEHGNLDEFLKSPVISF
jgi:phage terminase large subunit-like protein